MAAYRHVDFSYAGTGDPRNVPGVRATPDLFRVLRANAAIGRTFSPDEAVVGADRVVVVSHGFWQRVLGGHAGIVGNTIKLDGLPFIVVGVMPAGVRVPDRNDGRSVGAAGLRSQGRAWPVTTGAVAHGRRAPDADGGAGSRARRDPCAGDAHCRQLPGQQRGLGRAKSSRHTNNWWPLRVPPCSC